MEFEAITGSSNIMGIAYDENNSALYVEFKGGRRYRYAGVDQSEYDDFRTAPSKGEYFAANIKDAYPCQRV